MRLIGSLTSPYVRFVRVALAELGLEYEFEVTGPFGKTSPEHEGLILSANPLMKVPVLVTVAGEIIDSRIILGWLLANHGGPGSFGDGFPESLAQENALSTIYGVLEAGILRFILRGSHPEIDMESAYMARSMKRMQSGYAWLDRCEDLGEKFAPPEALLVCALEWMRKREVYDWSVHSRLASIYQRYCEREALLTTRIPDTI